MKTRTLSFKAQALVEFCLFATLFFTVIFGGLDYALQIMRSQTISAGTREAASSGSRQLANNTDCAINAALGSITNVISSNDFYANGGVIVTRMIKSNAADTYFTLNGTLADTVDSFGNFGGSSNSVRNMSKLIGSGDTNGAGWQATTRRGLGIPSYLIAANFGKEIFAVEVFYSNSSPSRLISSLTNIIYDKSFYIVP